MKRVPIKLAYRTPWPDPPRVLPIRIARPWRVSPWVQWLVALLIWTAIGLLGVVLFQEMFRPTFR